MTNESVAEPEPAGLWVLCHTSGRSNNLRSLFASNDFNLKEVTFREAQNETNTALW